LIVAQQAIACAVCNLCCPCRQRRKVPDALKQLVERCWDADYDKRPEMTEVIEELKKTLAQLPMEISIAQRERTADSCCVVQ